MLVTIDGEKYVAESIKQFPVNPLADAFRVTGIQQRSDNVKLNRYSFSNWNEVGLGVSRLRRQRQNADGSITGQHIGAMSDADAETRFASAITLPLLNQAVAHGSPLDHLVTYSHFKGDLFGMFESDYVTSVPSFISAAKYVASTDTWTTAGGSLTGGLLPTVDEHSGGTLSAGNAVLTYNHVVTDAPNRALVVFANASHTGTGSQSKLPASVTYNGVAMTLVKDAGAGSGGFGRLCMYVLVNPAVGTNAIVITYAANVTLGLASTALSVYNVDQTTPFSEFSSSTAASGAALSNATTDAAIGLTVIGAGAGSTASAEVSGVGSGQSAIGAPQDNNGASILSSKEVVGTASGTFEHIYSYDGLGRNQTIAALVKGPTGQIIRAADNTVGARAFALATHKAKLFALTTLATDETKYGVYSTADPGGASPDWSAAVGSAFPGTAYVTSSSTSRVNNWSQKYGDLLDDGDNLIVALYEDPASSGGSISQVRIGYSANSGTGWTFNAGLVIPCTDTPNIKLLHFNDLYTAGTPQVPVLVTSDNVYTLDIANNVFAKLLPEGILTGTSSEALAADLGSDGNLYISKSSGDIIRISIPTQGTTVIDPIGPASMSHYEQSDGLELTRQGYAATINGSDTRWLFVGYGGNASGKYASIFAMNYATGAWHSFYKHDSANADLNALVISTEDDGVPRLHATTEGAATCASFMFEEPLVPAISGVTQNYKTTGYVEWAEDDLGDPHTSAAVMRALIDDGGTMGSGTTTNYVQLKYGLDGGNYDAVTLGDFLSTAKTLNFDASNNRGVSAKTLKVRLNLFGADAATTNTPQIKEYEIQARNRVSVLRGWEIVLDLDASAEFQSTEQPPNAETVVSNLLTVQNSVTLVGLTVGEGAEAQVEMTTGEWMLQLVDASGGDGLQSGRVSGRALVVLEEVI